MKGLSIGIGGISRAGKTSLSNYIKSLYPNKSTFLIEMDDYVKNKEDIPQVRNHTDWEHPISVDFERLELTLKEALLKHDIVITEGILIFYSKQLNRLFDKRIFINVPKSVFCKRKREDKRWGNEPDWYIDYIWESYIKYGKLKDTDNNTLYVHGTEDWSPMLIDEHLYKIELVAARN
jgi:uridine kinase